MVLKLASALRMFAATSAETFADTCTSAGLGMRPAFTRVVDPPQRLALHGWIGRANAVGATQNDVTDRRADVEPDRSS